MFMPLRAPQDLGHGAQRHGTVRYSRAVTGNERTGRVCEWRTVGAAIAEDGRVIVAFDASNNDTNNTGPFRLTQARVFDPCGNPWARVLCERA
jgi:hypothetical protein